MKRFTSGKWPVTLLSLAALLLAIGAAAPALANEATAPAAAGPTPAEVQKNLDFVWTLVAAFLVFFMQAGFAMVESGFTRAKNAVNIMMKNLMDFSVGSIAFLAIGFGIMFGTSSTGWFGTDGFFLSDFAKDADKWLYAFWMFQVVFAATAATIVSGAMAERTKFSAYLVYSAVISALIYPVFGSWAWGSLYHGRRVAREARVHRFCRLHRRPFGGRLGRALGRGHAGPPDGALREGRQGDGDPRAQHSHGRPGGLHPVVRVVRVQPGKHDRRQCRHRTDRGEHEPRRGGRSHRVATHRVGDIQETGRRDDAQRRARRPRGDYFPVRHRDADVFRVHRGHRRGRGRPVGPVLRPDSASTTRWAPFPSTASAARWVPCLPPSSTRKDSPWPGWESRRWA